VAITAGPIPRERLAELESIPHVLFVEGSRPPRKELNHSVPEIKADVLHQAMPPHLGTGVVVGIIDSGVDFMHKSFRTDDGKTRILGIWDQSRTPTVPPTGPAQFPTIGVEYTQADIDATIDILEGRSTTLPPNTKHVMTVDTDGHGSHVAGIAAGDGSQNGNCRGSGVFVGVAPAADLLVVKVSYGSLAIGESANLAHAFDWVWSHPRAAGHPIVVNLSQGDNRGPHDGSSLVESALDFFLLQNRGHAVVKSAGNEGDSNRHAQTGIPPNGSNDVTFAVGNNDTSDRHVELWFSADDRLAVTLQGVVPAAGPRPSSPRVGPGESPPPWQVTPQVTATITSRVGDQRNGQCVVEIDLSSPPGVMLVPGEWQIHIENVLNRMAPVDLYIDNGGGAPKFTSHATRDGSLTVPGTAGLVTTVGAYKMKSFLFFDWSGDLMSFSSWGPTRDGRPKPNVAAPGSAIKSVRSQVGRHCCCDCCVDFYTDKTKGDFDFQGTSMAAPHVTGTIALMFEKDPTLHALDINQILMSTAQPPEVDAGTLPNDQWGGGRLNAKGAVDGVAPPTPIAGPMPAPHAVGSQEAGSRAPSGGGVTAGVDLNLVARAALASPQGQYWASVVSRNFSEVRGLINSNKRVAVCWHRMQGPQLVHLLRHVMAGDRHLRLVDDDPAALADWPPRAARFLDQLERFGSPALRDAVRVNRAAILGVGARDLIDIVALTDSAA
jgi:subtilisin family serine protease